VDKRMSLIQLNYGSHPTHLRIKHLKLSDAGNNGWKIVKDLNSPLSSGNYTCEVEWPGAPLSVTHSLTVLQPPVITRPMTGKISVLGMNITRVHSQELIIMPHRVKR
jgi:hypothetical protein